MYSECVCVFTVRITLDIQLNCSLEKHSVALKETCICWLKVLSEGSHMYAYDHANSLTQTRVCLSASC